MYKSLNYSYPAAYVYCALATGLSGLIAYYLVVYILNQSAMTLQRSTEFILFLRGGNSKTARKGGYSGWLCKLFPQTLLWPWPVGFAGCAYKLG